MKTVRLTLDKYLDAHDITRYRLSEDADIHYSTVDKYYKNTVVRYDSYILSRFCTALNCDISELIESVEEERSK